MELNRSSSCKCVRTVWLETAWLDVLSDHTNQRHLIFNIVPHLELNEFSLTHKLFLLYKLPFNCKNRNRLETRNLFHIGRCSADRVYCTCHQCKHWSSLVCFVCLCSGVVAWGGGRLGQLGRGVNEDSPSPVDITSLIPKEMGRAIQVLPCAHLVKLLASTVAAYCRKEWEQLILMTTCHGLYV